MTNITTDFNAWDMVFSTKEMATYNGHPNAPYLEEFGLTGEQLENYLHQSEAIRKKRSSDKFDNTLNTIWFILFIIGPFISTLFRPDNKFLGWIIVIAYFVLITIGIYLCHKIHFDNYEKQRETLYDKKIEFYIMSAEKYKRDYYNKLCKGEISEAHPILEFESTLTLIEDQPFTKEEKNAIISAVIVPNSSYESQRAVAFTLKPDSYTTYIPLSIKSLKQVGDNVDLEELRVLKYKMKSGPLYTCIMC